MNVFNVLLAFCIIWNSTEAALPLLHCICSQRGLGQTITLPFQMSWETDVLGSCANNPSFPSAAPVSHPGDRGSSVNTIYWEGSTTVETIPSRLLFCCHMAHLCILSQNKDTGCHQRLKLFLMSFSFFVQILQMSSTTAAHIICTQHTMRKMKKQILL